MEKQFEATQFKIIHDAGLFSLAAHDFLENKIDNHFDREKISLAYQVFSPETSVVGKVTEAGETYLVNFDLQKKQTKPPLLN